MRGFQPATKKLTKGGPVRGPGTGTSDEVADTVADGTYIMPTDSTEAIGEKNLAAMGKGAPVDVQLSNGEFKMPPEQVHAVGVQALDQMKNATHTPVAPRGFGPGAPQQAEPPLFFANGGEVDEENRSRFAQVPAQFGVRGNNTFGAGAPATPPPAAAAPAVAPAPVAAPPATPAAITPSNTFPQGHPSAGANIYGGVGLPEFGSSGKFAKVPDTIGQQPGRQQPTAPAPAAAPQAPTDVVRPSTAPPAPAAPATPATPMRESEQLQSNLRGLPEPQFQRDIVQRQALEGQIQRAQANERYESAGAQMAAEARAAATMRLNRGANRPLSPAAMPPSQGESALAAHDLSTGYNFKPSGAGAGRGFINPPLVNPNAPMPPQPAAAAPPAASTAVARTGPAPAAPVAAVSGASTAAPAAPTAPVAPPAPTADQIAPGIYRSGNSFGDSAGAALAGAQPRGLPSAQNVAAANALAQQSQQASTARVAAGQPEERGWSGVIGSDPGLSAAGRERRDLVSALTTPLKGAQNGQLTAAQRNGMLSLLDQEARGAQAKANNATALQQTEMRTNTQRDMTAMREAGDNSRAVLREAGETGRADSRNAIDQGRLDLEQKVRGFDIRAGQRQEKLYEKYDAAKTPEEKSAIAQQIRDLSGKADQANLSNNFMKVKRPVVDERGNVVGDQDELIDLRTIGQGGTNGQGAQAGIPKVGDTRDGYRYKGGNPNDKANWQKV